MARYIRAGQTPDITPREDNAMNWKEQLDKAVASVKQAATSEEARELAVKAKSTATTLAQKVRAGAIGAADALVEANRDPSVLTVRFLQADLSIGSINNLLPRSPKYRPVFRWPSIGPSTGCRAESQPPEASRVGKLSVSRTIWGGFCRSRQALPCLACQGRRRWCGTGGRW